MELNFVVTCHKFAMPNADNYQYYSWISEEVSCFDVCVWILFLAEKQFFWVLCSDILSSLVHFYLLYTWTVTSVAVFFSGI